MRRQATARHILTATARPDLADLHAARRTAAARDSTARFGDRRARGAAIEDVECWILVPVGLAVWQPEPAWEPGLDEARAHKAVSAALRASPLTPVTSRMSIEPSMRSIPGPTWWAAIAWTWLSRRNRAIRA